MRNLKRALSLALAAAMLIGMMVVGASAAEYKDADSIKNTEAVEVLTGLGVVGGSNGSYNPEKTLTRAEFCVMIANALTGGKFDKTLFDGADTPFTDIDHWGAAYIAYCYTAGVIAGTSATTFSPDKTLTAAQAEAILLSALGYNKNGEFAVNGQFSLNVTSWAQQAGLLDGVSVSANAGITRDAMAKILFNALTNTTPVGYSKLGESYYTVGTSALNGVVSKGEDLDATNPTGTDYGKTLGYTNFNLVKSGATDDYGRPNAYTWTVNGKSVADTYVKAPMATYTKKLTYGALYNLLTKTVVDNLTSAYTVTDDSTPSDVKTTVQAGRGSTATVGGSGNGVLTEVYYNNTTKRLDVVSINTYLAKVTAVTDATASADRYVTLALQGSYGVSLANSGNYTTNDFARDDYVLVTGSISGGTLTVKDAEAAIVVPGVKVTAVKGVENFTAAKTYEYAAKNTLLSGSPASSTSVTLGTTYNVIEDKYGYAIGTSAYSEKLDLSNYLVLNAKGLTGIGSDVVKANVTFADGTTAKEIVVGKLNTSTVAGTIYSNLADTGVYSYTVENGVYTLKSVAAPYGNSTFSAVTYKTGEATLNTTYVVNDDTVFVVKNTGNGKIAVYTGAKNVPGFASANGAVMAKTVGNVAALVYAESGSITGATTSTKDMVYVVDAVPVQSKDGNDTVYTFTALVNGVMGTIATKNSSLFATKGLYCVTDYTNGYVSAYTTGADTTATLYTGVKSYTSDETGNALSYANGVLKVNGNPYTCNSDVAVYIIAKDKTATTATTAALNISAAPTNTKVTLVVDVNASTSVETVKAVYIQYYT